VSDKLGEIAEKYAGECDDDCGVGSGFCRCSKRDRRILIRAALEEAVNEERQALLVIWQDGPSLPDCHACAVVGAALRGEGEK
jgi:hypothetical protein